MPRGVQHSEEFERIHSMEHNVAHGVHEQFGPSKRFTNKGLPSGQNHGSGINRAVKGKGASSKVYTHSEEGYVGKSHGSGAKHIKRGIRTPR